MKRGLLLLSLAFSSIAYSPLAFGQLSEKITVSHVEVPVTVVDGNGNPVRGLKAENFELSDDRGRREIASFDVIDFAAQAAAGSVAPAARRNFLLLFDLSNATPNKLERAQNAARELVKRDTTPNDLFAVGTIDADHGFRLVTAFTTDHALVADAIANPKAFMVKDPLGLANQTRLAEFSSGSWMQNSASSDTCFR